MKKNIKKVITLLACVLILFTMCFTSSPKLRVRIFVNLYHELIEEGLSAGNGVPADDAVFLGYKAVNSWAGSHPMTEFIILSRGNTYFGCYYSPDDVPLAFQNTDVDLKQKNQGTWEWNAEGDNKGSTSKLMDKWYFFKASF